MNSTSFTVDDPTTNWTDFYNSVFGGQIGTVQGSNLFLPIGTATGNGSATVTTPSGQQVQSVSPATDALNKVLGVSPLSGDFYKDPSTGATVDPSTTGGVNSAGADFWSGLDNWIGRGAIIVLGFIFVAVGLSMFKVPVVMQVVKSVTP